MATGVHCKQPHIEITESRQYKAAKSHTASASRLHPCAFRPQRRRSRAEPRGLGSDGGREAMLPIRMEYEPSIWQKTGFRHITGLLPSVSQFAAPDQRALMRTARPVIFAKAPPVDGCGIREWHPRCHNHPSRMWTDGYVQNSKVRGMAHHGKHRN
jgi:hypothetical protein